MGRRKEEKVREKKGRGMKIKHLSSLVWMHKREKNLFGLSFLGKNRNKKNLF